MRIAQISDFHYTRLTWNPFRLLGKRIFGNLNWVFSRKDVFSELQLEPLPPLFSNLKVDLVLLGGDFTTTALPEEFERAKEFVNRIEQPWIAIPGNHDQYTYRAQRTKRYYHYFSNKSSVYRLREEGLEIHPLSEEWTLIALDTARARPPNSSEGLLSEELESHLEKALTQIPAQKSILLFNHYPFFQNDQPQRNLERGEALETLLRKHPRIRLYLHGHTHRHTIADLQPSGLPLILDSGSAAEKNLGSWNLIDLQEKGCVVTSYGWKGQWSPLEQREILWTRDR